MPFTQDADEVKRLQRCINNLVSILALPAIWRGREPSQVIHTLLDALIPMADLELAYARLSESGANSCIEELRLASINRNGITDDLLAFLRTSIPDDATTWPALLRFPVGERLLSILPLRLGLDGQMGVLGVGSYRTDFPDQSEKLVLSVAANQAAIGLREASRLSTLTASIVHEVNQPLSGIVTNASTCIRMLDGDPPNIEGARETAKRTMRDGKRASDLIARLRSLYSKMDPTTEALDLNEVAQEVLALSQGELEKRRVLVRTDVVADLPRVHGDRIQIQQVILNLIRNAAEAMVDIDDRPRLLTVRTAWDRPDFVRFSVQDTGIGLGNCDVKKLFEVFYTTKDGGMGIGLSVSRSIIESHGGSLWAEPNTDGPGATFSFCIPVTQGRAGKRTP